ncbi:glyoxalase/bleomycin resistance protein/dioxygenase [Actinoplanes sp. N902-109]|uniref:glyoxalase/bleomycin resistance protein/dioxygenase n=1 Tax=Actinoplanes sp. (strain N902-109) TaxID=649831 RepID=UPI000329524D|nr:glyoxalase/bleomycin resistance protein/dioxygenase [Actinoplanes sp. N902-109]AGL15980.1 glyoxalase/bleomycin resistance protein/dioxygenase [Actinoplanes sp. N902-109]
MTVRGLHRVIVSVAELGRALALYRDALGLTEKYRAGEIVALAIPGAPTEVLLHERPPGLPGSH